MCGRVADHGCRARADHLLGEVFLRHGLWGELSQGNSTEADELEVFQESAEDLKHAFTSMYDAMLRLVWEKIGMPVWLLMNMSDKSEEDAGRRWRASGPWTCEGSPGGALL